MSLNRASTDPESQSKTARAVFHANFTPGTRSAGRRSAIPPMRAAKAGLSSPKFSLSMCELVEADWVTSENVSNRSGEPVGHSQSCRGVNRRSDEDHAPGHHEASANMERVTNRPGLGVPDRRPSSAVRICAIRA